MRTPKDTLISNGTNVNCTAWSMEKSGALTEQVEKHVHFRTSNDDLVSLDDETMAIMKNLETEKTIRHLGVFMKCNNPDTTETGRRAIRKVRMRIEDMKLRNRIGKVAVLTTNVLLVAVAQWNTIQAISPLNKAYYEIDKHMLSELHTNRLETSILRQRRAPWIGI